MANKLMTFGNFTKEKTLQDPKKEALVSGGEDKIKKEKFIDQVKSADLSMNLEITEPDYTKTVDGKNIDEAVDTASITAALTSLTTAKQAAMQKVTAAETALNAAKAESENIDIQILRQKNALDTAQATQPDAAAAAAPTVNALK
jgi:hypothetical protein